MTKKQEQPLSISGDEKQKLDGRKLKELDGRTAAMLEEGEVKAITGEGEDWWCPNPDCEVVDK